MLPFNLIGLPDCAPVAAELGPARDRPLLILYHGDPGHRTFLDRILRAAGYDAPAEQAHLLEWSPAEPLDLTGLARRLCVVRILLFGYELPRLGLHLAVANYFPVTVGGFTLLVADSLEFIARAKEAEDNRPAAALWNALQEKFLRHQE